MLDNPGQPTPSRKPDEDDRTSTCGRAVVVTASPDSAVAALTGSRFLQVSVLGTDPAKWPGLSDAPVDAAIVLEVGTDAAGLGRLLDPLIPVLAPDAELALSIASGDAVDADSASWQDTLAGWSYVGVGPVGDISCVLLRRAAASAPDVSAEVCAGTVVGALAGLAARRATPSPGEVELAAFRREAQTGRVDEATARGSLGGGTAPAPPRRRTAGSRRSRMMVWSAPALAMAVLVVVGAVTGASWWPAAAVATLVVLVALRQETWNRRHSRRLTRLSDRAAASQSMLRSLVASGRAAAGADRDRSIRASHPGVWTPLVKDVARDA